MLNTSAHISVEWTTTLVQHMSAWHLKKQRNVMLEDGFSIH